MIDVKRDQPFLSEGTIYLKVSPKTFAPLGVYFI